LNSLIYIVKNLSTDENRQVIILIKCLSWVDLPRVLEFCNYDNQSM